MTDNTLTQSMIAAHLDMSDRNLRDVLNGLGIDWKKSSLDEIRVSYIRDLREKAAGRGGDDNKTLARQRAEESAVNTAIKRLEYNQKINALVAADDAALAITDWCNTANREIVGCVSKLVSEIHSTFKIDIPSELVNNIVNPAILRIQDHASSIGENLVEGGEGIYTAEETEDSGVDQQ